MYSISIDNYSIDIEIMNSMKETTFNSKQFCFC